MLNGKNILITGASSGIGKQAAIQASEMGATIIACGRNENELNELKKIIGSKCNLFTGDLTNSNNITKLVSEIEKIDGLVHSAGIVSPVPAKFIAQKHIDEIFQINFNAPVLLTSALLQKNKINANSSIVFISSISTEHPYFGGSLYVSSKAAIEAYSRNLALELSSKKIRANVLQPALVKTKIFEETIKASTQEEIDNYEKQYPLGFGEPEDVANAITFLLSDKSKWITGTCIKMDGGLVLSSKK